MRLALNLKGLEHQTVRVSLLPGESGHRQDTYRTLNPQMLVTFLEGGDFSSGQSQAILEYLEEACPNSTRPSPKISRTATCRKLFRGEPVYNIGRSGSIRTGK